MAPDADLHDILQRAFPGARLEAWRELKGGVSARAVAVDLNLRDGTRKRVVVRRPSYPTPEEALRVVRREHAVLSHCAALGLPAPPPCFLDVDARALVLEHIDGAPDFAPADMADALAQMAARLAVIHGIPVSGQLASLSRRSDSAARAVLQVPERLDASLNERELRAELARLWPWPQYNADALLHGDYWPGNLLWTDGKLSAVLDWEEAELGDPLADVAVSRLDILWAFGEAAMHTFTERYREQTQLDWRNLARWDLCVALRPMSNLASWSRTYPEPPISRPDITEASMREGHRRFVEQALHELGRESAPR